MRWSLDRVDHKMAVFLNIIRSYRREGEECGTGGVGKMNTISRTLKPFLRNSQCLERRNQ